MIRIINQILTGIAGLFLGISLVMLPAVIGFTGTYPEKYLQYLLSSNYPPVTIWFICFFLSSLCFALVKILILLQEINQKLSQNPEKGS